MRARTAAGSQAIAPRALVFGIYPGGASGAVGPSGPLAPEDPARRLAGLAQLRAAGQPFVLHIYAGYTGAGTYSAAAQVGSDLSAYAAAGFQVEVVLCYRPSGPDPAVEVPGFVRFVRQAVDQLGRSPGLVSLQVTNEANVSGAPNASDGYYPGARDALIQGVIAAKGEAGRDRLGLKVGFNWAYQAGASESAFWSYLAAHGGQALIRATDWVGVDAYPGTWQPQLDPALPLADAVAQATTVALRTLRLSYLTPSGFPAATAIHVSEAGYPTGPGRTVDMQATALRSIVQAVVAGRATYNVSDFRWFDLRDANSSSGSFEAQYGLMTDGYAPKPAFAVYRSLVAGA